ncbi:MAG: hypothetical protein RIG68_05950 [Imperialibacter sp.]|uniref:hypothetical protein n=1 Tax=Imperialibacter sp. TaxID=2038411 RepID=UPI0032F00454
MKSPLSIFVVLAVTLSCTSGTNTQDAAVEESAEVEEIVSQEESVEEAPVLLSPATSRFKAMTEFTFDKALLDSLKKPYSIVDYFLLAPTQIFGGLDRMAVLKTEEEPVSSPGGGCFPNIKALDRRNGFMEFVCNGDGGGESFQITFWKQKGQPDLVGFNKTTWGMCCDESELLFLQLVEGEWNNVTSQVLPDINYKIFMKPGTENVNQNVAAGYLAELPKSGKDISLRVMGDLLSEGLAGLPELRSSIDAEKTVTLFYDSGKFSF